MLIRGISLLPRRTLILGRPLLGPKKKKKGGGGGGGGKTVEVKVPDPETDFVKLTTTCCGINIHSENILTMYEWTDEQKKTLFDEPKLKPDSEYPDWLWTEDFLTDINSINIESIEPGTDLYWKKFEALEKQYNDLYFAWHEEFRENQLPPLHELEFKSHFPNVQIKPRSKSLKNRIIKSAPYANQ